MIRPRTRMYGSRIVVQLAEPDCSAAGSMPLHSLARGPYFGSGGALEHAMRELSCRVAAHLLETQPEAFGRPAN